MCQHVVFPCTISHSVCMCYPGSGTSDPVCGILQPFERSNVICVLVSVGNMWIGIKIAEKQYLVAVKVLGSQKLVAGWSINELFLGERQ